MRITRGFSMTWFDSQLSTSHFFEFSEQVLEAPGSLKSKVLSNIDMMFNTFDIPDYPCTTGLIIHDLHVIDLYFSGGSMVDIPTNIPHS